MIVHASVHISSGDIIHGRVTDKYLVVKFGGRNGVDVYVHQKHPSYSSFYEACERIDGDEESAPAENEDAEPLEVT